VDKKTYENWVRIKELLEASGKTDSFFYKRAVYIVQNKRDPGPGI
jgi:hypothetical protein